MTLDCATKVWPASPCKRQPPDVGDRQPDNLDRLPPCPYFPLFRRRQPVPHQGIEQLDREAMRLHDRLGAAVRRASERPALFGAEALWAHRHCAPVRLSRGGCSRQFGRASAPMIPQRLHTMRGRMSVPARDLARGPRSGSSDGGTASSTRRAPARRWRACCRGSWAGGPRSGSCAHRREHTAVRGEQFDTAVHRSTCPVSPPSSPPGEADYDMDPIIEEFVHHQTFRRFQTLLAETKDEPHRHQLSKLFAEE
jgi:hypothetical protein